MQVFLPNSAFIGNIEGSLRHLDTTQDDFLRVSFHEKWVSVHPVVLAITACLADHVRNGGGEVEADVPKIRSLPYLVRMGLFRHLGIDPVYSITDHESSGRFVPLTQIKTNDDHHRFITDMIPLLHADPNVSTCIKYAVSELVRNVLEHSGAKSGAFVCAQYFKKSNKVSIGIADCGIGIRRSICRSHRATTDGRAVALALTPGITGTTARVGGTAENAGAGLFFVKSIAKTSRNFFVVYSGGSVFKLRKTPKGQAVTLQVNPNLDFKTFWKGVPSFPGTVIGIDISAVQSTVFQNLLAQIHKVYRIDVKKQKKQKYKKARFV